VINPVSAVIPLVMESNRPKPAGFFCAETLVVKSTVNTINLIAHFPIEQYFV